MLVLVEKLERFKWDKKYNGTFQFAKLVLIDVEFLNSFSRKQMAAGYAEMIKHSLIDKNHEWEKYQKSTL